MLPRTFGSAARRSSRFGTGCRNLASPISTWRKPCCGLPLATLRILDLARALASEPDVLLLDEMTAALPTDLVERVLKVVRQQCEHDRSVIYISHRFAEISALCDRATVLRDGETVGTVDIAEGTEDQIVEMMLGAPVKASEAVARKERPIQADAEAAILRLRVQGLAGGHQTL